MLQKKKLKMIFLGTLFSIGVFADPVVFVNGESVEKLAAKITFDGNDVTVKFSDGVEQSFDMSSIVVEFSSTTGSSLTQNSFFSVNSIIGNQLSISGMKEGAQILIYDISGKIRYAQKSNSTNLIVDLSDFEPAVYLLKVDNQIIRFIKE